VVFKSRIFSARYLRRFTMKNGRFSDAQRIAPRFVDAFFPNFEARRPFVNGGAILGHGSDGIVLSRAA
jgi:hypothetical protein